MSRKMKTRMPAIAPQEGFVNRGDWEKKEDLDIKDQENDAVDVVFNFRGTIGKCQSPGHTHTPHF